MSDGERLLWMVFAYAMGFLFLSAAFTHGDPVMFVVSFLLIAAGVGMAIGD